MTNTAKKAKAKPVASKAKAAPKKATTKAPLKLKAVESSKPKIVGHVGGYDLEAGVPIPEANSIREGSKSAALLALNVGERIIEKAVVVPDHEKFKDVAEHAIAVKDEIKKARARLTVAKRRVEKNNAGLKFVVREIEGGAACWRLA